MSREIVESFQRGTAAYNRGDWDSALLGLAPDVEFDLTSAAPDGVRYRGHAGVKEFWRMLRDVFGDFRIEVEEIIDGDNWLLARVRLRSTGRASGAMTEDVLYQVLTGRKGEQVASRVRFFRARAEALEAVGLRE